MMRHALVASLAVLLLTAFLARHEKPEAADFTAYSQRHLLFYRIPPLNDSLLIAGSAVFERLEASRIMAEVPANTRVLPLRTVDGTEQWALLKEPPYSFEKITADNLGRRLAIALNELIYSPPVILEKISDEKLTISGQFSFEEVNNLASTFNAGRPPRQFVKTDVPTLPLRAQG